MTMPNIIESTNDRDLSTDRVIESPTGNNIHIRSDGVFGHWTIHFEMGTIPAELTGKFTRYGYAEEKVLAYLERKEKERNKPKKVKLPGPRE